VAVKTISYLVALDTFQKNVLVMIKTDNFF